MSFCRVGADGARGFEQLRVGLLSGFLLIFAGQERDAPRAEEFRLVHRLEKRGLRFFPALLVEVVGVQLRPQQPRLRAVADLQMRLRQKLPACLAGSVVRAFADLHGVEKFVAGYFADYVRLRRARIGHPGDRADLKILVDRISHDVPPDM